MTPVLRCLAALLLAVAGTCTAAPLRVATLSTVLTEIARTVGGPDVEIAPILAPGVDPHTFEPSPGDLKALADADLVLASGLGLENYLSRVAVSSGSAERILEAGSVLASPVHSGPRAEPDPHWWHSLAATIAVTEWVGRQFSARRPEHARDFAARAAAFARRLDTLRSWTRTQLAHLPPNRRGLVTTHDAFGWFARDYGFEVRSIEGLSTESEPDAQGFAQLVQAVRRLRITCIFPEYGENTNLAEALCRETGAHLGSPLYADGLVPEPDGGNFESMYRHNVLAIAGGLR